MAIDPDYLESLKAKYETQNRKSKKEEDKPSWIESVLRGLGQGLSLGTSDEIVGGLRGLGRISPFDPKHPGSRVSQAIGKEREDTAAARKESPWLFGGAELASAFVPGGGIAKAGTKLAGATYKGMKTLPAMARGAVEGTVGGGLAGAGYADGDDESTNRAIERGAGIGGALGAGLAGATRIPGLNAALAKALGGKKGKKSVADLTAAKNELQASKNLEHIMGESKDFAGTQMKQDPTLSLVDALPENRAKTLRDTVSGHLSIGQRDKLIGELGRRNERAQTKVNKELDEILGRENISSVVERAAGKKAAAVKGYKGAIKSQPIDTIKKQSKDIKAEASKSYDDALGGFEEKILRGESIDNLIGDVERMQPLEPISRALNNVREGAVAAGKGETGALEDFIGNARGLHEFKQSLDGQSIALQRSQNNTGARFVNELGSRIDGILKSKVPGYEQAGNLHQLGTKLEEVYDKAPGLFSGSVSMPRFQQGVDELLENVGEQNLPTLRKAIRAVANDKAINVDNPDVKIPKAMRDTLLRDKVETLFEGQYSTIPQRGVKAGSLKAPTELAKADRQFDLGTKLEQTQTVIPNSLTNRVSAKKFETTVDGMLEGLQAPEQQALLQGMRTTARDHLSNAVRTALSSENKLDFNKFIGGTPQLAKKLEKITGKPEQTTKNLMKLLKSQVKQDRTRNLFKDVRGTPLPKTYEQIVSAATAPASYLLAKMPGLGAAAGARGVASLTQKNVLNKRNINISDSMMGQAMQKQLPNPQMLQSNVMQARQNLSTPMYRMQQLVPFLAGQNAQQ